MVSMPVEPPADDRAERMVRDPDRYYADARERADDQVQRATRPARSRRKFYARPTPGVVHMSARAVTEADLDRLINLMRASGLQVWLDGNRETYRHDDGVYCRYLSVRVPEGDA